MAKAPSITKRQLLSNKALTAYSISRYKISHKARYSNWTDDQCLRFCLKAAFDAVAKTDEKNAE
jgi:hypothetical protein